MSTDKSKFLSVSKPWLKYYDKDLIATPIPECSLYEYLYENNKSQLDNVALVYYGRKITFGELFSQIDKATLAFMALGVKAGDTVTISSVNTPEVIYSFYALNRLGAASNMVDPRTNIDRIAQCINDTHSNIVMSIDKALPKFIKIKETTNFDTLISISPSDSLPLALKIGYKLKNKEKKPDSSLYMKWNEFIKQAKPTKIPKVSNLKNSPATIVYTGGTTGFPKGAILSNYSINALTVAFATNGTEYIRGDKFLNIMPPFIAYGISCGLNMPLCLGVEVILIPQFNPDELVDLIIKHRPNHFIGVPSFFEKMATNPKAKDLDLSCIKTAAAGGDALSPNSEDLINEFFKEHGCKFELIKGYGMTELGSAAASTLNNANRRGSVGIPLPQTVITVRDPETGEELTANQEGELYITSPAMMMKYLNNSTETGKVFCNDENGVTWVKTGDIGYVDQDGFIFILGRMKRMIIRPDGHNVWPSLMEDVIYKHEWVNRCAVVGLVNPDGDAGKIPTAFVELKPDCKMPCEQIEKELDSMCRNELPERDIPLAYRFCDKLPLTAIGKIDYRKLEKED